MLMQVIPLAAACVSFPALNKLRKIPEQVAKQIAYHKQILWDLEGTQVATCLRLHADNLLARASQATATAAALSTVTSTPPPPPQSLPPHRLLDPTRLLDAIELDARTHPAPEWSASAFKLRVPVATWPDWQSVFSEAVPELNSSDFVWGRVLAMWITSRNPSFTVTFPEYELFLPDCKVGFDYLLSHGDGLLPDWVLECTGLDLAAARAHVNAAKAARELKKQQQEAARHEKKRALEDTLCTTTPAARQRMTRQCGTVDQDLSLYPAVSGLR
jgi:hypothetical protein